MKPILMSPAGLNPRSVVEKVTLKKIAEQVPEALPFMKNIGFEEDETGLHLNLQSLPPDIAKKIEAIFA